MLDISKRISPTNYIDLAHDVYYKLVKDEDLTQINNLQGYIFKTMCNYYTDSKKLAAVRYRAEVDSFEFAVNDFMDTEKLNRLNDFELSFIAVIIACDGNMMDVHKLTKISRKSCNKYKNRIFDKLK